MKSPIKGLTAVVIGLGLIVAGCSAASEATEMTSEAAAAVEINETAYIEAFLQKDLDAFMETMAEDVVFVDETFGDHLVGKAAVRNMYVNVIRFADPDASGVLDRFVSLDATFAASTWDWIGTNAFGKPFDLPIVLVHEYRDGKIVKETTSYASPDAYGQLMGS